MGHNNFPTPVEMAMLEKTMFLHGFTNKCNVGDGESELAEFSINDDDED